MIIDSAAIRSLADLYRREQAAGHCLDPDQAATTAVAHLLALGYRSTVPHHGEEPEAPGRRGGPGPVTRLPAPGRDRKCDR